MAVVCDRLVYLQLHKTACTTIGSVLVDVFDGVQVDPPHAPLPGPRTSKFVLGSVRNPWDYYVSLWAFGCAGRGGLHQLLTERFWKPAALELPDPRPLVRAWTKPVGSWRRLYADAGDPALFRDWLRRVHDPRRAREIDLVYARSPLRFVAGLATYRYCQLYAGAMAEVLAADDPGALARAVEADYLPGAVVRMEHLADDLVASLRRAGYEVGAALERDVRRRTETRHNPSAHRRYTEYYDEATRDLVARRECVVIERHGYRFDA